MIRHYRKFFVLFLLSLGLRLSLIAGANTKSIEITVKDKVVGKTMTYLGPSGLTGGPSAEVIAEYIKDSGFNTTKFWVRVGNYDELSARKELYGPRAKEIAIRQVTGEPEKIDWELELQVSTWEPHLDLCKRFGIQPVFQMIAPFAAYRTYSLDPLVQQVFWRYVFLYCYWANKVKNYNFILWSMGSENPVEASIMETEVGSEAVREAEKLTGVKVLVSGPGDDWNHEDILAAMEGVLKGEAAQRLDGLSFQSFNFFDSFPEKQKYPTYFERLQTYDQLQRNCRPGKPLLTYWDTSWHWRDRPRSGGYNSDWYVTGLQYISRLIWGNLGGVVVSTPYTMYGAECDSLYGKSVAGMIKVDKQTKSTRPGRGYYAMRMIARATVGGKERLEVEGLPGGDEVLALASQDSEHFYFTIINRTKDTFYNFRINLPSRLADKVFRISEFSEMLQDQYMNDITNISLPVIIQIEPLAALQLVTER
ncbi:MAG TPA: hypothetical protein VM123_11540 [archaeon]|nr:hypothetical protein [archaeon]